MFRLKSYLPRPYLLALLTFITGLVVFGTAFRQPMEDLRNFVFDTMQRANPLPPEPDGPVRIVDVDEASLTALGQWPWPRSIMADIVSRLQEAGAAAIVFDIVFSETDRTSPENMLRVIPDEDVRQRISTDIDRYLSHDLQFARRIQGANVVLGMTLVAGGGRPVQESKVGFASAGDPPDPFLPGFGGGISPLPVLLEHAQGLGATNWLPDRDQVIRNVPLLLKTPNGLMPSLALEALRVAQGASTIVVRSSNASGQTAFGHGSGVNAIKVGAVDIETGPRAEVRVRFSYSQRERFHSAANILAGRFDEKDIQGKIVLVGTSAIGLADLRATPLEPALPGVEVHAQIIEHILSGKNFYRPDWMPGVEWILAILLGIGLWVALPLTSVFSGALIGAVISAMMLALSIWLFTRNGLHFDPAFPALAGLAAYLISSATLWQSERLTRSQLRLAFGKFLAPAVVDRLAENPERLVLGGETRDMTIMFSDLRDFTGLSEGLDAQNLTRFMNAYLSPMTDIILESSGTVDKYIGDAIVAFWNAPLDDPDHISNAVSAALEMRLALATFNQDRARAATAGETVLTARFGIGLNTGPCSVGNMGSNRRFDYSALGDTVNLASRLEGISKEFGVDIVASKSVVDATNDFAWLNLGDVRVKGKKQVTALFFLCGDKAFAATQEFQSWKTLHDRMVAHFNVAEFQETIALCAELDRNAPAAKQQLYSQLLVRITKLSQKTGTGNFVAGSFDAIQSFDTKD
jgi:adenylate cyclase